MTDRYFVTWPPARGSFAWFVVRDRDGEHFPNEPITYYFKSYPHSLFLAHQEAAEYNAGFIPMGGPPRVFGGPSYELGR